MTENIIELAKHRAAGATRRRRFNKKCSAHEEFCAFTNTETAYLRPDQMKALRAFAASWDEIRTAPERVSLATFYINTEDLLKDSRIVWWSNLSNDAIRTLIEHTHQRLARDSGPSEVLVPDMSELPSSYR